MNVDDWLATQREELIGELSARARRDGILSPGQQIVFTLQVEEIPTVVASEITDILDLHIPDFFTRERCAEVTEDSTLFNRIRRHVYGLHIESGVRSQPDRYPMTIRDVVELGTEKLGYLRKVGKGTIELMRKMLESEDIFLSN